MPSAHATDVVPATEAPRIPVRGGGVFPVRRIYCVGRNFADHAKEMGATAPAAGQDKGRPVFFMKPADAIVLSDRIPYPTSTQELHHEVELVVAIGATAPASTTGIDISKASSLVYGYGVGLDLTRRDLQAEAKAKGLPWDIAKGFDHSAPVSELIRVADSGDISKLSITLFVDNERRQHSTLDEMVWSVDEILHELTKLYTLMPGDLVFMGTPAGVGPLQPDQHFEAILGDHFITLKGRITKQVEA